MTWLCDNTHEMAKRNEHDVITGGKWGEGLQIEQIITWKIGNEKGKIEQKVQGWNRKGESIKKSIAEGK